MTDDITERVVSTAKRLESYDDPEQIDWLERKYEVSHDATVHEVTLVLTTGGPQIEVNCLSGRVYGHWASDSHTTHVDSTAVDLLGDLYARTFEENYK
ncbi:hypothetical protein OSG_eHP28_00080 [environmental Halophage eHP-28]|nr:hypothetical protein OSG_eHP28_00080 [environmental Halophage eHP-28]